MYMWGGIYFDFVLIQGRNIRGSHVIQVEEVLFGVCVYICEDIGMTLCVLFFYICFGEREYNMTYASPRFVVSFSTLNSLYDSGFRRDLWQQKSLRCFYRLERSRSVDTIPGLDWVCPGMPPNFCCTIRSISFLWLFGFLDTMKRNDVLWAVGLLGHLYIHFF